MAGNYEFVDPAGIESLAGDLNKLNENIGRMLQEGMQQMDSLKSIWDSQAANLTNENFKKFYSEYSEKYHEALDAYVRYLKNIVRNDFAGSEEKNIGAAEAFA